MAAKTFCYRTYAQDWVSMNDTESGDWIRVIQNGRHDSINRIEEQRIGDPLKKQLTAEIRRFAAELIHAIEHHQEISYDKHAKFDELVRGVYPSS